MQTCHGGAPRIALIHAPDKSVARIREAFARLWPEARTADLLDISLSADLAAAGHLGSGPSGRRLVQWRHGDRRGRCPARLRLLALGKAATAVDPPCLAPTEDHSRRPISSTLSTLPADRTLPSTTRPGVDMTP
ncbi:hypothetical protein FA743_11915 [Paracoccus gahaiensis]|uniref:Uncharacterized protein n=1 Tax=Paracoccus gahaiensis TaxID=1706839 RepID=A0A4U0R8B8_9RHOB|nr:hypothetical protein FA743_11915 [Paracoccus gahaiensis]